MQCRTSFVLALCFALAAAHLQVEPKGDRKLVREVDSDRIYTRGVPAGFTVTYPNGVDEKPKAVVEAVLQVLASTFQIGTKAPIRIEFKWSNLGDNTLGQAGPNGFFPKEGTKSPAYPITMLVSQLGKYDVNSEWVSPESEIHAEFNKANTKWYFGTDGTVPDGQTDFFSVVLHEFTHGLGFTGFLQQDEDGTGLEPAEPDSIPAFDYKLQSTKDATGKTVAAFPILNFKSKKTDLMKIAQQDAITYKGASGSYGMYSPDTWAEGTSLYHLNDNTKVMYPTIAPGEARHTLSAAEIDILTSIGWVKKSTRDVRQPTTTTTATGSTSTSSSSSTSTSAATSASGSSSTSASASSASASTASSSASVSSSSSASSGASSGSSSASSTSSGASSGSSSASSGASSGSSSASSASLGSSSASSSGASASASASSTSSGYSSSASYSASSASTSSFGASSSGSSSASVSSASYASSTSSASSSGSYASSASYSASSASYSTSAASSASSASASSASSGGSTSASDSSSGTGSSSSGSSSSGGSGTNKPTSNGALEIETDSCLVSVDVPNHLGEVAGAPAHAYIKPCKAGWKRNGITRRNDRAAIGTTLVVTFDTNNASVYDAVAQYIRSDPPALQQYDLGSVKVIAPSSPQTGSGSGSGSGSGTKSGGSSGGSGGGVNSSNNKGLIIGLAVGVFVVAILIGAAVVFFIYYRQSRAEGSYTMLNNS